MPRATEPSKRSLREIPEVDFSRAKQLRRGKYADEKARRSVAKLPTDATGHPMPRAPKRSKRISVSVGADTLKRAKLIARRNGITLSRLVTDAIVLFAEEEDRRAAARELVASFPREARVTKGESEALRKQWSTPHQVAPKETTRQRVGVTPRRAKV
jgi:hypothetical protein